MNFKVDNRTYEIIDASTVFRIGQGIELWDMDNNEAIIEIFRNDEMKSVTFFFFKPDIPLSVLEVFLSNFEQKVGRKYQD